MNRLPSLLKEIAQDQGESNPDGRYFEKLLALTSGRISQLMDPLAKTSLGSKSISRLVALGYNPQWLSGESKQKLLHKQQGGEPATPKVTKLPPPQDKHIAAVIKLMENTDTEGRVMVLAAARFALKDHRPSRKQRGSL